MDHVCWHNWWKKFCMETFTLWKLVCIDYKTFWCLKISKKLLNDKVKCLHLFQCFAEVGGDESVRKLFEGQVIDLSGQTLSPNDISTLVFYLVRSVNKHWNRLDLSNCNIGVTGCKILLKQFFDKSSKQIAMIDEVNISHNLLEVDSTIAFLEALKIWCTSVAVINEHNSEIIGFLNTIMKQLTML